MTRSVLALLCSVTLTNIIGVSFAQDVDLRGTVPESALEESKIPLKKAKKRSGVQKSRLASKQEITVLERYQPTLLDPNDEAANSESADRTDQSVGIQSGQVVPEGGAIAEPIAVNEPDRNAARTVSSARSVEAVTMRNTVSEAEIPEPFTRQLSDSDLQRDDVGRMTSENDRTGSIEGKEKPSETDPYSAPGLRAGSFVLRPTFEAGLRYTNNPNDPTCNCVGNRAESKLLMRAESDWLRHAMNLEAEVSLKKAFSNKSGSADVEDLDKGLRLSLDGKVDITDVDQVNASLSFEHASEVLDTSSVVSFAKRPIVNSIRGSVGYAHDAGVIGVRGTLRLVRETYGDALDFAGATLSQDDRDFTNITATLRGSYDLSPVFVPFLEGEVGRRQFDNRYDRAGLANSATRYALRVGSEINFGEKLNGELAGGWFVENIDDASLKNVTGFDLRGTMNWSPLRGTNVALTLGTEVDGAKSATSSTSVLYSGSVAFTRRMRANLDANALLSASLRNYQGGEASQTKLSAEVGATWWFNRFSGVKGSVRHSQAISTDTPAKRPSTGVYLGVVLRR